MEEAYRTGGILEKAPAKAIKEPFAFKREDIDLIVSFYLRSLSFVLFDSDMLIRAGA
jgi:hypothetical protein